MSSEFMRARTFYYRPSVDEVWRSVVNSPQGVTKRCRLSWLTNSSLVHEPKCGRGGGLPGLSQWVQQLCTIAHGAQINFGDVTPLCSGDKITNCNDSRAFWNKCVIHISTIWTSKGRRPLETTFRIQSINRPQGHLKNIYKKPGATLIQA